MCFRIVYREVKEDEGSGHEVGGESTPVLNVYSRGSRDAGTLSSTTSPSTPIPGTPSMSCTVEDVLQLLRHLFVISTFQDDAQNTTDGEIHIYYKYQKLAVRKNMLITMEILDWVLRH
jgi:E3 ubiquitin-protein ligase HECTD1